MSLSSNAPAKAAWSKLTANGIFLGCPLGATNLFVEEGGAVTFLVVYGVAVADASIILSLESFRAGVLTREGMGANDDPSFSGVLILLLRFGAAST